MLSAQPLRGAKMGEALLNLTQSMKVTPESWQILEHCLLCKLFSLLSPRLLQPLSSRHLTDGGYHIHRMES